jgi:hypothetical protein
VEAINEGGASGYSPQWTFTVEIPGSSAIDVKRARSQLAAAQNTLNTLTEQLNQLSETLHKDSA